MNYQRWDFLQTALRKINPQQRETFLLHYGFFLFSQSETDWKMDQHGCSKCLTRFEKFCISDIYYSNRKRFTPLNKWEGRKYFKK